MFVFGLFIFYFIMMALMAIRTWWMLSGYRRGLDSLADLEPEESEKEFERIL
jgi:hypothetical protein